jgi:hypothetical protein
MFASAVDFYIFLGKETSKTIIPTALLCGTFSVFMLVLDVLTIMDCSNMRGYDVVRPEVGLSMTALVLNAWGIFPLFTTLVKDGRSPLLCVFPQRLSSLRSRGRFISPLL